MERSISNETNTTAYFIEWLPGLQMAACIFYSIILLVGVIGNILVITIVTRYRDMRNATNLLLTNLSVADLFLLVFCIADGYQHLYGEEKHRLGKFMCKFSPFVQNATSTCSVLTIMAISYERYVAICQPLKTSSFPLTLFRTFPTIIFFWCISCLISVPFYKFTELELRETIYDEIVPACLTAFPRNWKNEYMILCTLCLYLFIFLLLCYWHFSICCILFSREALLRDNTILTRYRRQVAQLLIVLILTFFILILPYKIWAFVHHRLTGDQLEKLGFHRYSFIAIITRSLLYLNSAINPLLYSVMSTKFRQSFMLLCEDCARSTKSSRSETLVYYKDNHPKQPTGVYVPVAGRTATTTTARVSYHQPNGSHFHEKKSLLVDHLAMPVIEHPIDDQKLDFSHDIV